MRSGSRPAAASSTRTPMPTRSRRRRRTASSSPTSPSRARARSPSPPPSCGSSTAASPRAAHASPSSPPAGRTMWGSPFGTAGPDVPWRPSMSKKPGHPFEKLAALRDALPAGPAAPAPPPQRPVAGPGRAVVRLERKGRGGKEATLVERLELAPEILERWCRELKQALGCGGHVDGEAIVLQGDLRQRLPALLEARGVRKVTLG